MFTPYAKIASSTRSWKLDVHDTKRLDSVLWVATEKIHGANFCLFTQEGEVLCAKRKAVLDSEEDFFGHTRLIDDLSAQVRHIEEVLRAAGEEFTSLLVYGELFGGSYPHEDVDEVDGVQAIQTGVWYSPNVHFCAFDLFVYTQSSDTCRALSYARALDLFKDAGMMAAQPLFVGSWTGALAMSIEFDSTLPAALGLPPLPKGTNGAEGVVIKPMHSERFETKEGWLRPILKRKTAHFSEDKRYSQAQRWETPSETYNQTSLVDQMVWEAYNKVTLNRLHNTISKLGQDALRERSKRKALFGAFVRDVLEDLPEEVHTLHARDRAKLLDAVRTYTRDLFKTHAPQQRLRDVRRSESAHKTALK